MEPAVGVCSIIPVSGSSRNKIWRKGKKKRFFCAFILRFGGSVNSLYCVLLWHGWCIPEVGICQQHDHLPNTQPQWISWGILWYLPAPASKCIPQPLSPGGSGYLKEGSNFPLWHDFSMKCVNSCWELSLIHWLPFSLQVICLQAAPGERQTHASVFPGVQKLQRMQVKFSQEPSALGCWLQVKIIHWTSSWEVSFLGSSLQALPLFMKNLCLITSLRDSKLSSFYETERRKAKTFFSFTPGSDLPLP